ncbi:MAG: nucleotidyltransferase domain-containing protein [Anaerolineae bacterium]
MVDVQPVIEALQAALLRRMGPEVDLIIAYGSQVRGDTHAHSDVDLSWVPAHESVWDSVTVLVDDTLYDLYPIHWSTLERMAGFRDVSSSVLLHHRVLYQRDEAPAVRLRPLAERLRSLLGPEHRAGMLRQAMALFQQTGPDYLQLRMQAGEGHRMGSLRQAQAILRAVLHCLAVCNQACIDTRRLEQVLALPRLPEGFAEVVRRVVEALEPGEILAATDALLWSTREMLLDEQRHVLRSAATYATAFDSGYPELRRTLQAVMQACERRDRYALNDALCTLLHEVTIRIDEITQGVEFSGFSAPAGYEQDLTALGFPALLPLLESGDLEALRQQCAAFDARLRELLTEQGVGLNAFATPGELQVYLDQR